jgi:hypothetical protein
MTTSQVVYEFEWHRRGFVRATLDTFGGKQYVSLRLWVEPRDQPGATLIPTKRGLSLPLEFLPEVVEALEAVGETIKQDKGELADRARRRKRGRPA